MGEESVLRGRGEWAASSFHGARLLFDGQTQSEMSTRVVEPRCAGRGPWRGLIATAMFDGPVARCDGSVFTLLFCVHVNGREDERPGLQPRCQGWSGDEARAYCCSTVPRDAKRGSAEQQDAASVNPAQDERTCAGSEADGDTPSDSSPSGTSFQRRPSHSQPHFTTPQLRFGSVRTPSVACRHSPVARRFLAPSPQSGNPLCLHSIPTSAFHVCRHRARSLQHDNNTSQDLS